jgi:hypothetical protein
MLRYTSSPSLQETSFAQNSLLCCYRRSVLVPFTGPFADLTSHWPARSFAQLSFDAQSACSSREAPSRPPASSAPDCAAGWAACGAGVVASLSDSGAGAAASSAASSASAASTRAATTARKQFVAVSVGTSCVRKCNWCLNGTTPYVIEQLHEQHVSTSSVQSTHTSGDGLRDVGEVVLGDEHRVDHIHLRNGKANWAAVYRARDTTGTQRCTAGRATLFYTATWGGAMPKGD